MNDRLDIRAIFGHAIELANLDERRAYLNEACARAPELRHRVEMLLQAHDDAGSFMQTPATPASLGASTAHIDEMPETVALAEHPNLVVVGRYKLLQQIGEGGMGVVWMAEQMEPVKRTVALKVIKPGMDSAHIIARFEQERQALALMDHPNIAKVLDAGTTPAGRPFFVMEMVKGIPITKYCDEQELSPHERIALFVPVCQAIQHAHQKGIIHRDIKPSNVMVANYDGRAVPKVIDFGVAKATGQRLTEKTLFTGFGGLVGTLEYMAPEQAEFNALDIDTRSDVYSLGVLLFELLTGSTPLPRQRLKEAAISDVFRLIREEQSPRPSSRLSAANDALAAISKRRKTDPTKLAGLMRGDLDWIVLKAIDKDRTRRYETAIGLARDLERYLADEPVEAGPPSVSYRVRKFVRRNRIPVVAASLVLLALVGGIMGTTLSMLRAERLRVIAVRKEKEAEDEKGKALASADAEKIAKQNEAAERKKAVESQKQTLDVLQATTDTVIEQIVGAKPSLSSTERAFIQKMMKRWEALVTEKDDGEMGRQVRAYAVYFVASLRVRLGDYDQGLAGSRQASELFAKLADDFPANPGYLRQLALCYNEIGLVFARLGKHVDSEAAIQKARSIQEKLEADGVTSVEDRRRLAKSYDDLGIAFIRLGKHPQAEQVLQKALAIQTQLAADSPDQAEYQSDLARSHYSLGGTLSRMGKRTEAEKAFRQALEIQQRLVAESPEERGQRDELARSHLDLGIVLATLGKALDAQTEYREAHEIWIKLAAEFPVMSEYRQRLAATRLRQGNILAELGKLPEAESSVGESLAILEKLVEAFPVIPEYRHDLARCLLALGDVQKGIRKLPEAQASLEKGAEIAAKLAIEFPALPDYRRNQARIRDSLGLVLSDLGKNDESESAYREAIALQAKLAGEFPALPEYQQDLAWSYIDLCVHFFANRQPAKAEESGRQAQAIFEKLAANNPEVPGYRAALSDILTTLGSGLTDQGRYGDAEAAHREAVSLRQSLVAEYSSAIQYRVALAGSYVNLGEVFRDSKRPQLALEWYGKAIANLEIVIGQGKANATARNYLRNAHLARARAYNALTQFEQALPDWDKAVEMSPNREQFGIRMRRAETRVRAGKIDSAIREADELAKSANGAALFDLARIFALAAEPASAPAADKEKYLEKAGALLRQAAAKGWKNVERLKKDDELKALRERENVKKLIAEMEKKSP